MKTSTFCVLLASALLLMSALAAGGMKYRDNEPQDRAAAALTDITDEKEGSMVSGRIVDAFGAAYDEGLNQWTMREYASAEVGENAYIASNGEYTVISIEAEGDGSSIVLAEEERIIRLWPVAGVRVFEGSRLNEGEVIGTVNGKFFMAAEENGRLVNPEYLIGSDE